MAGILVAEEVFPKFPQLRSLLLLIISKLEQISSIEDFQLLQKFHLARIFHYTYWNSNFCEHSSIRHHLCELFVFLHLKKKINFEIENQN